MLQIKPTRRPEAIDASFNAVAVDERVDARAGRSDELYGAVLGGDRPRIGQGADIARQKDRVWKGANISPLGGISNIVRLTPCPMLLCDRNDLVIAASESSGFQEGRTALSQTPEFQHAYFGDFSQNMKSSGFWEESGRSRNDAFISPEHGAFKAVLVSIKIQGAIYCVVQAVPSGF